LVVSADNDIGFTVIQIAARIVLIIEGKHKMQRREMRGMNARLLGERSSFFVESMSAEPPRFSTRKALY